MPRAPQAECRLPVMGTTARVVLMGAGDLLPRACERLRELESRWTRFEANELTELNRSLGRWTRVSDDTYRLVATALTCWRETQGRFDPTVLEAMRSNGYSQSLGDVTGRVVVPGCSSSSPGRARVEIDPARCAVRLPEGVGLDAGGVGKGLAANMVSQELLDRGAIGALVSVGGDLRARGRAPNDEGWSISVEDPCSPGSELARFSLDHGAVASSSRVRRCWRTTTGFAHHIVDPRTGSPSEGPLGATVVAADCWWAEPSGPLCSPAIASTHRRSAAHTSSS